MEPPGLENPDVAQGKHLTWKVLKVRFVFQDCSFVQNPHKHLHHPQQDLYWECYSQVYQVNYTVHIKGPSRSSAFPEDLSVCS